MNGALVSESLATIKSKLEEISSGLYAVEKTVYYSA